MRFSLLSCFLSTTSTSYFAVVFCIFSRILSTDPFLLGVLGIAGVFALDDEVLSFALLML